MSFGIPVRNGLSVSLVSSTFLSSGRRLNPALNLDFLTGGTLDPRITFSRTSQATLVDSTGKLTYAPNNLILNSEAFEAASWTAFEATVTANATTAPNGTTTADKLSETTANNIHFVYPTAAVNAVAGGVYIISVYAKASERSWLYCFEDSGTNANAFFNLSNGTIGTVGAGATAAITSVGNGWYRCSITYTQAGSVARPRFSTATGNNTSSYTGTAGSGIFLWGAQLEQVTYQTTPGTYNSTSPKNLLGYTQEFDNAAWTKSNAFVQTNLLLQSQAFEAANWTPVSGSVSANTATAPDGTLTADTLNLSGSGSYLLQNVSISSGVTYTISFYIRTVSGSANIRLVTDGGISTSADIPVGSTWQRVTYTATSSRTATVGHGLQGQSAGGATAFYIWGAQLVQGSTAGDYQRTDAAAAAVQYVAPDGSLTADKLVETTSTTSHIVYNTSAVTTVSGTSYTVSLYAKQDGRSWVQIVPSFSAAGGYFNLATGALGTITNGTGSITDVGGGWYRCSLTFTANAASGFVFIQLATANGTNSYTGDGTSGIYIWGAQLSNSASLDPYVYNPVAAPTSAAYYGPRFDYDPVTLANKGLLIEEQRTNLLTYSEQFDNAAWIKTRASITANATTSPDGTVDADKLVEDTSTNTHFVTQSATVVASTTYTYSVYLKAAGRGFAQVRYENSGSTQFFAVNVDLSSGAVTTASFGSPTGTAASATNAGNGWWRVNLTVTASNTTFQAVIFSQAVSGTNSYTGDGTSGLFIYGAQLEAASFATSYIPTVASQVTRTADVALMQGANFSNWYNQNEGTLASSVLDNSIGSRVLTVSDGTVNNQIFMNTSTDFVLSVYTGGVYQAQIGTTPAAPYKIAGNYATNNFAAVANGGTVATDTSGSIASYSRMQIGANSAGTSQFLNGHIRSISYYNTRLPNTALVSLTAPNIIPSLSLDFTTQVFNVG